MNRRTAGVLIGLLVIALGACLARTRTEENSEAASETATSPLVDDSAVAVDEPAQSPASKPSEDSDEEPTMGLVTVSVRAANSAFPIPSGKVVLRDRSHRNPQFIPVDFKDGIVELERPFREKGWLYVLCPGYQTEWDRYEVRPAAGEPIHLAFELQPIPTIEVTVRDREGQPIPGARVLWSTGASHAYEDRLAEPAYTDANGFVHYVEHPYDGGWLEVRANGFRVWNGRIPRVDREPGLDSPLAPLQIEAVLAAPIEVVGVVRWAGLEIENPKITLADEWGSEFLALGSTGVFRSRFASGAISVGLQGSVSGVRHSHRFDRRIDENRSELDIEWPSGSHSLRVKLDPALMGLTHSFSLRAIGRGKERLGWSVSRSDGDAHFSHLPAGEYEGVVLIRGDRDRVRRWFEFSADPEEASEQTITPGSATVLIDLAIPRTDPSTWAIVVYRGSELPPDSTSRIKRRVALLRIVESSEYTISGLEPGTYVVVVAPFKRTDSIHLHDETWSEIVELSDGAPVRLRADLNGGR